MLTYYWPPAGGPGVQRILKFCKYLKAFGWNPIVITPANGTYPYYDETLLAEVPHDVRVIKTKTREPFSLYNMLSGKKGKSVAVGTGTEKSKSLFGKIAAYVRANYFLPDARIGWKGYAVEAAEKLIRETEIHAIISTGPPHSTHISALELKKNFGLPWLADFRDPWTSAYFIQSLPRTEKTKRLDKRAEQNILSSADVVTVVSAGLKKELEADAARIELVYNGFDELDLSHVDAGGKSSKFTLAYIGNFKPNQNVSTLWSVLGDLIRTDKSFANSFQLEVTGVLHAEVLKDISDHIPNENFLQRSFVSHHAATELMSKASMLLFIIPNTTGNKLIITGKIFEYMASGNNMLSIGPFDGEAAQILHECGRHKMIEYNDNNAMKHQIAEAFSAWQEGKQQLFDSKTIQKYSRKGMTRKLADILNDISHSE